MADDDKARAARMRALSAMYNEGATAQAAAVRPRVAAGERPQPKAVPLPRDDDELKDAGKWSKTRIVEAIPGWSAAHSREVAHLKKWLDGLVER